MAPMHLFWGLGKLLGTPREKFNSTNRLDSLFEKVRCVYLFDFRNNLDVIALCPQMIFLHCHRPGEILYLGAGYCWNLREHGSGLVKILWRGWKRAGYLLLLRCYLNLVGRDILVVLRIIIHQASSCIWHIRTGSVHIDISWPQTLTTRVYWPSSQWFAHRINPDFWQQLFELRESPARMGINCQWHGHRNSWLSLVTVSHNWFAWCYWWC